MDVVIDMKKLNKKPKFNKEKMIENKGSSMMNKIKQVNTAVERYSSSVLLIPLIFRSFFRSSNNTECGSIYLIKYRIASFS